MKDTKIMTGESGGRWYAMIPGYATSYCYGSTEQEARAALKEWIKEAIGYVNKCRDAGYTAI